MAMERKHKDLLANHRLYLVRNVTVDTELLASLAPNDLITDSQAEEIMTGRTAQDRVGKLLDILARRGPTAFKRFLIALIDTKQKDHALKIDRTFAEQLIKEQAERDGVSPPAEPSGTGPSGVPPTSDPPRSTPTGGVSAESVLGRAIPGTGPPGDNRASGSEPISMSVSKSSSESSLVGHPVQVQDDQSPMEVGDTVAAASDSKLVEEAKKFISTYQANGSSFMTDEIGKVKASGQVANGRYIFYRDSVELCDNVSKGNLQDFFEKLGFKIDDCRQLSDGVNVAGPKDSTDKQSKYLKDGLQQASKQLESDKNDGLVLVTVCDVRLHNVLELIYYAVALFASVRCLANRPKLFFFQFLVGREHGKDGIDEVDTWTHFSMDNGTAVMRVDSYELEPKGSKRPEEEKCKICGKETCLCKRPNLLPWTLIKIFSDAAPNDNLKSLLEKVAKFLAQRKDETKRTIFESQLSQDVNL